LWEDVGADPHPEQRYVSDTEPELGLGTLQKIHGRTVTELEEALRAGEGFYCALFQEGTTVPERDRAAAWLADPAGGPAC
jgi:hypothetical protein